MLQPCPRSWQRDDSATECTFFFSLPVTSSFVEIIRRSQCPFCASIAPLHPARAELAPPISRNPFRGVAVIKSTRLRIQRRRVLRDCRTRFKTIACRCPGIPAGRWTPSLDACVRTAPLLSFSFLGPEDTSAWTRERSRERVGDVDADATRARGAFDAKKFSNAGYRRLKDVLNGRCLCKNELIRRVEVLSKFGWKRRSFSVAHNYLEETVETEVVEGRRKRGKSIAKLTRSSTAKHPPCGYSQS